MPHADQAAIDLLTDYFAAMEAKDLPRLGEYYAEDIALTFANAPTVTGREAVLAQMTTLLWRFPDGVEATINACSIFTIADGKFTDQRIYVDNSPIDAYLS
jgi:ketosteroid isomerase-like protein